MQRLEGGARCASRWTEQMGVQSGVRQEELGAGMELGEGMELVGIGGQP